MGAPVGNQYAIGEHRPGAGRKSAYFEKRDAYFLRSLFFKKFDKDKLKRRIASGNYSLKDIFVAKAFQGDARILSKIFDKLFADYGNYNIDAAEHLEALDVKKPQDVVLLLAQTISQVKSGGIGEKTASSLGILSGHLIKAFETTDMEKRLEKIEQTLEDRK